MNSSFSIYLDLIRCLAAFLVYLYHSNQRHIIEEILPMSNYGHSAVIVFFVLSGFVISYVSTEKEKTAESYFISRLSRILSVAIPAIFLTIILDSIGRQFANYNYPFDYIPVRAAASVFMSNELWFTSITLLSNVPYWSITYEFWYYLLFGFAFYFPKKQAFFIVTAICIVIGPKILLLFPIWLLGCLLYRWKALANLNNVASLTIALLTAYFIYAFHIYNVEPYFSEILKSTIGEQKHKELTFSKFFVSDYILSILIFLHFAGMRNVCLNLNGFFKAISKPVKNIASYSFTFYILHQPLFLFWHAVIQGNPKGISNWLIITLLVFLSTFLIGKQTELRRHIFKAYLAKLFLIIQNTKFFKVKSV